MTNKIQPQEQNQSQAQTSKQAILDKNSVEMTSKQWKKTHNDFKGLINGEKTVLTIEGLTWVEIVDVDWYGTSTGQARMELINQALTARGWMNGKKGNLTAVLESERFRYLEVFKDYELLCDIDMRGFTPSRIDAYLDQLELTINSKF